MSAQRRTTHDDLLQALEALTPALEANVERVKQIRKKVKDIERARARGRPYGEIIAAEERPLMVELISQNLQTLADAGSRVRRAEARVLHEEGLSMERIASLFGVTRQRISALLQETVGAGGGAARRGAAAAAGEGEAAAAGTVGGRRGRPRKGTVAADSGAGATPAAPARAPRKAAASKGAGQTASAAPARGRGRKAAGAEAGGATAATGAAKTGRKSAAAKATGAPAAEGPAKRGRKSAGDTAAGAAKAGGRKANAASHPAKAPARRKA
jgi:hypothetical protein